MSATNDQLPAAGRGELVDVGGAQVWVEERGAGDRIVLSSASHIGRYPAILAEPPCDCHVYSIQARGYGRSTHLSAGRRRIVANRRDRATVEEQFRIIAGAPASPEQADLRERTIAEVVERTLGLSDEESVINQGMPFPEATSNEALATILATIYVPTLILAGMRDGVVSPQSTLRAACSVPRAKAVLFEDEGHFISRERPERLVAEVKLFLDQLEVNAYSPRHALPSPP